MRDGSYLAVLADGTHRVGTGVFATADAWSQWVARQTFDVKVTFAPGTYYYQCDPHALLGMKGHLKVVAR